jgi:hypothetical protein
LTSIRRAFAVVALLVVASVSAYIDARDTFRADAHILTGRGAEHELQRMPLAVRLVVARQAFEPALDTAAIAQHEDILGALVATNGPLVISQTIVRVREVDHGDIGERDSAFLVAVGTKIDKITVQVSERGGAQSVIEQARPDGERSVLRASDVERGDIPESGAQTLAIGPARTGRLPSASELLTKLKEQVAWGALAGRESPVSVLGKHSMR